MALRPPLRLLRALLFTVVCVTVTLAAHAAASRTGVRVPPAAALVGGVGVLGLTWLLAGHERSPATILGALLGGQFGLHTLFSAAQVPHSQPEVAHLSHQHAAPLAPSAAGPGMSLTHVAVAIMLAWWLWRGERAVWSLARRLAAAFSPALLAPPDEPYAGPARLRTLTPANLPVSALLRRFVVSRAPPFRSQTP